MEAKKLTNVKVKKRTYLILAEIEIQAKSFEEWMSIK